MNDQTIFRVHRDDRDKWTIVVNETIRDQRLSFKATGVLIFLLSLPGDWESSQCHLATVKTDGRDSVMSAFKELQEAGYVKKETTRNKLGHIKTVWHVFESPRTTTDTVSGFPTSDNPTSENPTLENPTLRKTKGNKGLKKTKGVGVVGEEVPIPESLNTPPFQSAWALWKSYRKESRLKAYCATSARAQLSKLEKLGPDLAVESINNSIAQQWQGIHVANTPPQRSNGSAPTAARRDANI